MNLSSWQKEKINQLAEYQEALSDFFTCCSEKFPDYRDFWLGQALPKLIHADWLRYCIHAFENGTASYNMMRFRIESIQSGLEYMHQLKHKVCSGDFTHPQALAQAISLESGLLSARFFEIVVDPEGDMADLIDGFKADVRRHMGKFHSAAAGLALTNRRIG